MTQTLKTTERLGVVDALRGFALLAIVLLHNLEHYNLFLPLDYTLPACVGYHVLPVCREGICYVLFVVRI